jgi:hypothetical protein
MLHTISCFEPPHRRLFKPLALFLDLSEALRVEGIVSDFAGGGLL